MSREGLKFLNDHYNTVCICLSFTAHKWPGWAHSKEQHNGHLKTVESSTILKLMTEFLKCVLIDYIRLFECQLNEVSLGMDFLTCTAGKVHSGGHWLMFYEK